MWAVIFIKLIKSAFKAQSEESVESPIWMGNGWFSAKLGSHFHNQHKNPVFRKLIFLTQDMVIFRRPPIKSSWCASLPTTLSIGSWSSMPWQPTRLLSKFNWPCLWVLLVREKIQDKDEEEEGEGGELLELLLHHLPPSLCARLAQLPWNISLQHRL